MSVQGRNQIGQVGQWVAPLRDPNARDGRPVSSQATKGAKLSHFCYGLIPPVIKINPRRSEGHSLRKPLPGVCSVNLGTIFWETNKAISVELGEYRKFQ